MSSNPTDLFNQLVNQQPPTNQYQAITCAPSNALAQGNVLLKITCGDDIRCRSVSEDYGWEDLQYTVQQMFAQDISPRDPIILKFRDSEGDWVRMASEDEYNLAKQLSPKLHICVSQKGRNNNNVNTQQLRKELVRLRDEINSILECLATQKGGEETNDTSPPNIQPPETKKQQKEAPQPDNSLVNSVLDVIEDSKPLRTVSPQQAPPAPPAPPVPSDPPRQYSNLTLPSSIMPNSGQTYPDFSLGTEHQGSRNPGISGPPTAPTSTQPSAPSSVPSASSLFHAQSVPFNVPQPPYPPPQGFPNPSAPNAYPQYYSGYYQPK